VQDIDSYTDRDRMRPMRDSKVGMLPPKLAQTMINLADPEPGSTVLDPFCGTGVVLQEALLMGFGAYGTDISPRMIKYSEENLAWLRSNFSTATQTSNVEVGDAKTHKWTKDFQAIAGETYLGEAFVNVPKSFEVEKQSSEVNAIIEQFLVNLGSQIKSGTKLCVGVPQWQLKNQTFSLPVIDNLQSLGYTWERFSHVDVTKLVYRRPGQTVGRQLLTLVRK